MRPRDEPGDLDDELPSWRQWLVAYDEALRAGAVPEDDTAGAASDDPRLRGAMELLNELEAVWPRSRGSSGESCGSWATPSDAIPANLGRFRILRELGRGGGGIVYLAYDPKLRREVALKLPRPEWLLTPELRRRFMREADAAAQLDHRSIVPIHEAGEIGGVCYLVSAYCAGPNLADWLRSHVVSPRQAAQIVADLANGVAHMHTRGILHRDIKPRNVLLEPEPGEGDGALGYVPRLTDFGLAKVNITSGGVDGLPEPDLTRTGAIIGTPAYMAPEQAEGRLDRIGPATDVYGLGVLLYEMLTGRRPFQGNSDADTLRRIVSDEPTRVRRLRPRVPRDLDTICLKCLCKDPGQRYDSALELARDLQRHLRGETVRARPMGAIAQCAHWSRRHPSAVLAIASLLALLLALPGLVWYEVRLKQAQQVANTQELYRLLFQVKERRLRHPPGWTWDNVEDLRRIAELNPAGPDLPLWRSEQAAALMGIDLRLTRSVAPGFLAHEAAFTPDGKLLALVQGIGDTPQPMRVLLVDPVTGNLVRELKFPSYSDEWQEVAGRAECSNALAISPEGRWLVVGMRSGHIHRWNLNEPQAGATSWKGHAAPLQRLGFTGESGRLCSLDQDGNLKTWVIERDWQEAVIPSLTKVESMVTIPADGLVACHAEGQVSILDGDFVSSLARWPSLGRLLAVAPDGLIMVTDESEVAALRKSDSGTLVSALAAAVPGYVPAFSRDASLLAQVTRASRHLTLWDVANGRRVASTVVPQALNCVAFHPAGALLAVPAEDRTYLYEMRRSAVQHVVGTQGDPVRSVAFGFAEEVLWSVAEVWLPDRTEARLTETPIQASTAARARSRILESADAIAATAYPTAVHPRRDLLVCAGDRNIWCCEPASGQPFVLGSVECVNDLCFDPAGTLWVADHHALRRASDVPGPLRSVWQSNTEDQSAGVTLKSLAAGDSGVLVGRRDGTILWFAEEQLANTWKICTSEVRCLAISQDERFALAGTELGKVFQITLPDGAIVCELPGHSDCITGVSFLDAEFIASGSRDGTIRVWSVDGTPLLTLDAPGPVGRLQATRDGTRLAVVVEGERAVRLWNLDQLGAQLAPFGLPLGRQQVGTIARNFSAASPAAGLSGEVERSAELHGLKTEILATSPVAPAPGTLSVVLDGGGNLVVTDRAGVANQLTIRISGTDLVITDGNEQFMSAPAGGTLGNSNQTLTIPRSSVLGSVTINGAGGNDTLTVDFSGGDAIPDGNLFFHGGHATSSPVGKLVITGGAQGTVTYNYTRTREGSVVMSNFGAISYTGLAPIKNSGTAADIIFNLPAGPNAVALGDDGTRGNGLSRLSGAAFETTDFANPTGSLTINRGSAQALTIQELPDFHAELTVGSATNPFASLTFTGAVSLAAGKALRGFVSGEIKVDGPVTTSAGALTLSAGNGITLNHAVATGGGAVDLNADSDADGSGVFTLADAALGAFIEQSAVRASDAQADDCFGYSVSVSGDTALVGAYGKDGGAGNSITDSGAAYVFTRDGGGLWTQQAILRSSDAHADDYFGFSVSVFGDTALVGACRNDGGARNRLTNSGAAYVFTRDGGGHWTQQAILWASDAQRYDGFGSSVSLSGETALVGSYGEDGGADNPLTNSGAAYVFTRDGGGHWTEQAILRASDAQADDYFGYAVSVSGDTALVGAHGADSGAGNPQGDSGDAYVFTRDGAGDWTQQAILRASDAQTGGVFGYSVSVSGDTALVGAHRNDGGAGNPQGDSGAAYVFTRDGAGHWTEQAILRPSDAQASDAFGASVSVSGDTALVGAYGEDGGAGNPQGDSGAAYVFTRDGAGNWTEQAILRASDAQTDDYFGSSVSVSGDTAFVGAWGEDAGAAGPFSSGAAYAFGRSAATPGGSLNAGAGHVTVTSGDVN